MRLSRQVAGTIWLGVATGWAYLLARIPKTAHLLQTAMQPVRKLLGTASGQVRFSVAQVLLVLFGLLCVFFVGALLFFLVRGRMRSAGRLALRGVRVGLALVLLFSLLWTSWYQQTPLSELLGLDRRDLSAPELYETMNQLVAQLNESCGQVARNEDGVFVLAEPTETLLLQAQAIARAGAERYPFLTGVTAGVKGIALSSVLDRLQLGGFYFPYTAEANINTHLPAMSLPASALHELSHQQGIAREEEACFFAFLLCEQSENPEVVYSGRMYAYLYLSNALYTADPALFHQAVASLDSRIWADLADYNAYVKRNQSAVSEASEQINNHYLKAQGQSAGTRSYGLMVDLLCAWYETQ